MINVTKSYLPQFETYEMYIKQIWKNNQLTNNGPLSQQLESQLKSFLDVEYLQYVSNGTIALQIALKALNIEGDVITTPYSYVATLNSIIWEGCNPVFVDIDEENLCIDPSKIEKAITKNTKAIMATHVYGYPCKVEEIEYLAKEYNLKVIYDAAHCFGVRYKGKSLLKHGDISTLSFHATKVFHTVEGGAIISRNSELDKKIWLMKKFGHIGEEEYVTIGINGKNSEFHAAMGLSVLPDINKIIEYRKNISQQYTQLLEKSDIVIPRIPNDLEYNYSYYPVIFSSEQTTAKVLEKLVENDIKPRKYFYPSLNTLEFVNATKCEISESISKRVLCLPLFYGIKEEDVNLITNIIKQAIQC